MLTTNQPSTTNWIYAFCVKATDPAPITLNGVPEFSVVRFLSESAYLEALNKIWTGPNGMNLVKASYQEVFSYFGYVIWLNGRGWTSNEWLREVLESEDEQPAMWAFDDEASRNVAQAALDLYNNQ